MGRRDCPIDCRYCHTFTALCYVCTAPRFLQMLSHIYLTVLHLYSAQILANLVSRLLHCVTSVQCPDSCRSCLTFTALCYVCTVPGFLQILSHVYCTVLRLYSARILANLVPCLLHSVWCPYSCSTCEAWWIASPFSADTWKHGRVCSWLVMLLLKWLGRVINWPPVTLAPYSLACVLISQFALICFVKLCVARE